MSDHRNDQQQFKDDLRKDTGPDFDLDQLDRMEAALMARVSKHQAQETARRTLRSRVGIGIGALAMAAAAALVIGRSHGVGAGDGATGVTGGFASAADPGAGAFESGSEVSVTGTSGKHVLGHGESLKRGDELETTRAVFRASGRVVFAVSSESMQPAAVQAAVPARVAVTETDRPIVLSLVRGVVEAQVDKVPSGEAFAVDVPGESNSVRIAVHGTHLRVARTDGHVTLDLTEGIVNVGRPPKSGSTYGKLVTAPAHVEFDIASLETSFVMTKDADKVRVAEDLTPSVTGSLAPLPSPATPEREVASPIANGKIAGLGASDRTQAPQSAAPQNAQAAAQNAQVAAQNEARDPGVVPAPAEPRVDARTAINDAIASCALEKLRNTPENGGANAVTVTLVSTLSLRIGDDGYVQAARFEPPLDPAVQKCAAGTIYKVHFAEPGHPTSVMMPISLKTPR